MLTTKQQLTINRPVTTLVPGSATWYSLECVMCHHSFSEQETYGRCLDCGQGLTVTYTAAALRKRVDVEVFHNRPSSLVDFHALFPFADKKPDYVSRSEGNTPLIHLKRLGAKYGLNNLYAKNEAANPTGVFKDRGSLVELTKAKAIGVSAVCCASTGNMAASVSAYAALAGLSCYVFVPEGTPLGKMSQSIAYGANVIVIKGSYDDCVLMCESVSKNNNYYLAGDYAFRSEGQKTVAYELYQQLGGVAPDAIVMPMGCGTNLAAMFKGWQDLKYLGLVSKLPRMIGVQPDTAATIVDAWRTNKTTATLMDNPKSVASAVCVGKPLDDVKALQALYKTDGLGITASDEITLLAQQRLGKNESLFVEPSSALSVAVLQKLLNTGMLSKNDVVVSVLTGTGLKDTGSVQQWNVPKQTVLEADVLIVNNYIQYLEDR